MKKRVLSILAAALIVLSLAVPVFASMTDAPETYVDMSNTISSVRGLFGDFTLGNVFLIIGAMLGLTLALTLGWWVFRWLYGKVKGAFKGGRG